MHKSERSRILRQALTLTELVIVLAILIALAGVVIQRLSSTNDTAQRTVAITSASEIRDAVLQFWSDCKYAFPTDSAQEQRIQLGYLFERPEFGALADYDPDSRLGWNGPYLDSDGKPYTLDTANGFTAVYGNDQQLAARDPYISQDLDGNNSADSGSPFVIQEPTLLQLQNSSATYVIGQPREIRVVSAGPDGFLDIAETSFASELEANPSLKGDDIYVSFTLR